MKPPPFNSCQETETDLGSLDRYVAVLSANNTFRISYQKNVSLRGSLLLLEFEFFQKNPAIYFSKSLSKFVFS